MEVQSLRKIAFEKVKEYGNEGKLIVPVKVPSEISNSIFERAYKHAIKPSCPIDFRKLSITRAHVHGVDKSEILHLLTTHEIKEIGLSFLHEFHRTYAEKVRRNDFQFVCDCLLNSRNSLTTLVCPEFSDEFNWLDALLPLHPNLCNLDFEENTWFQFSSILNVYPQVTFLNFSNTGMINLEGMSSRFPNIEVLYLSNVRHRTLREVRDIFQLENLKVLDIACSYDKDCVDYSNIDENPWYFGQPNSFPSLEFVDYSQKRITPEMLEQLFAAAPKLKKIGLVMTDVPDIVREGVEILCTKDLPSAVEAFKHYHSDNRHLFVGPILQDIFRMLWLAPLFETHKRILWELLDLLLDRIEINEEVHDSLAKEWAIKSTSLFCQLYSGKLSEEQKKTVLLSIPYNDADRNSCLIFALPDFIHVGGLNPFFFFQKSINFFLDWHTSQQRNQMELYQMFDALHSYGSRLSDKTLAGIRGKRTCFEKINCLLCEMWAVQRSPRANVEWIHSQCLKVKAVQEQLMASKIMLTIEEDQVINIGWFEDVPIVQLTALQVLQKQLFCLKSRELRKWVSSVGREEFEILVRCLMGDFDAYDYQTESFLQRKIAMISMKILALLVQIRRENKTELLERLRIQAVAMDYRDYSISALKHDHLSKSSAHSIIRAKNAGEWAATIYKELVIRRCTFPKLVKEKGVFKNISGEVLVKNDADQEYT